MFKNKFQLFLQGHIGRQGIHRGSKTFWIRQGFWQSGEPNWYLIAFYIKIFACWILKFFADVISVLVFSSSHSQQSFLFRWTTMEAALVDIRLPASQQTWEKFHFNICNCLQVANGTMSLEITAGSTQLTQDSPLPLGLVVEPVALLLPGLTNMKQQMMFCKGGFKHDGGRSSKSDRPPCSYTNPRNAGWGLHVKIWRSSQKHISHTFLIRSVL